MRKAACIDIIFCSEQQVRGMGMGKPGLGAALTWELHLSRCQGGVSSEWPNFPNFLALSHQTCPSKSGQQ